MEEKIDRTTTALLLLHWQNDLAKPEGKSAMELPERIKAAHTLENTQAVLKASREKGILVAYVRVAFRPGMPELPDAEKHAPLASSIAATKSFVDGTWGGEIIDELKPMESEMIINNYSTSAFCSTPLDLLLRNHGIKTVVISGLVTNFVVESTTRDAFNRGYFVTILEDCVNSWSDEWHTWTLKNILPMLATISNSKAYIDALGK